MPNGWLEKNGMDRRVKYRVLRNLEAAELIKADWRNGKNPLITWIACDL
jgi:RNA-binding protein YhbY